MSYSGYVVARGGLVAPIQKLPSLFDRVWADGSSVQTDDDIDGTYIDVNECSIDAIPDDAAEEIADLDACGMRAIELSGRKICHFDISLIDCLVPEGGVFVYEDGDVDELEPAKNAEALRAVIDAVLSDDLPGLLIALERVPPEDQLRLPTTGIERLKGGAAADSEIEESDEDRAMAWADNNKPTVDVLRSLIAFALGGDALAHVKVQQWCDNYRETRDKASRALMIAMMLEGIGAAKLDQRATFHPWIEELAPWEELEKVTNLLAGDDRFGELLEDLRETAAARRESDFSDL